MAAVIVTSPRTRPAVPHPGPSLRVIHGGRSSHRPGRLHPAVYRRRRLGALLLLVALVVVAFLAVTGFRSLTARSSAGAGTPVAGAVSTPAASTAGPVEASTVVATDSASPAASDVYVVQPGDTLWTIARRLQPSGDIRPLVDELSARHGGASLEAGEHLRVDGLRG